MNHAARAGAGCKIAPVGARLLAAFCVSASLALAACSSGSGGDDVTIGSGQSADPVTLDFPVFYIKRPVPDPDDMDAIDPDARELVRFDIGADLFMKDRASPSAPEVNLTSGETQGLGDVRDVDVSYDGTKAVFAMRARFIENADEEDQPTWNIWEYDVTARALRRVIASDTTAEQGHDIMPHYLPDGRIVFTSTRQRTSRAILLDEGKPQYAAQDEDDNEPAFLLHVMQPDGSDIRQISFNQSHDIDPSVLPNGQIVFTRWEHHIDDNQLDIYRVNPDGTGLELLYGATSHNTGTVDPTSNTPSIIQFLSPRAMPDGRTLALVRPFQGTEEGGDLVLIDTSTYLNNTQPLAANAGLSGPAQARALPTDVRTIPGPSPGGRYRSAAPLFDGTGRLLVSWSQCRLVENGLIVPCTSARLNNTANPPVTAPPLYGVYIYDVRDNTQQPVVVPQEGFMYTEVVAGSQRTLPPVILDDVAGVDFPAELETENVGILDIRSVYDIDGVDSLAGASGGIAGVSNPASAAYTTRPARFIRIEKAVSLPDEDLRDIPNTAFGPAGRGFGMRDILGYAPIEPDGSVKVRVPANVAFMISILDANGRRIGSRHTNWLQVRPGETLQCTGCHNPTATPPRSHGRSGAFASVNAGAPAAGVFPNTNTVLQDGPGQTMAQTRWTVMCTRAALTQRGGNCELNANVLFDDVWLPTPDPARRISFCYRSGPTNYGSDPADLNQKHNCAGGLNAALTLPTSESCAQDWNSRCRTTIHYEQHIHPLWNLDRFVDANNDGLNDLDGNGVEINHKCNTCHSLQNAAAMAQVPAGQLDLSDGASDQEADHFKAYRELLFGDNRQILDANGNVVDELVQVGTDPVTGDPQFAPVPVASPMSVGAGARNSAFFQKFDVNSGTMDHRGWLTPAELRLLAEWLDIGAQYYNDPFVAPEN